MSHQVGVIVVDNHGLENETRVAVIRVVDVVTGKQEYRLDVYDVAGNLIQRVGYVRGLTQLSDGSTINGDRLRNINVNKRVEISEYATQAGAAAIVLEDE